jgi:hypothetical protein
LVEFHRDIFNRRYRKGCVILGFSHSVKGNLALLRFYAVSVVCCIKVPEELSSPVQERRLKFYWGPYVLNKKGNHFDISAWYHDTNPV